jgi:hypothetical protein
MSPRLAIPALLAAAAIAVALVLLLGDDGGKPAIAADIPGQPRVEVISPRNGSRQTGRAVVVKVQIANFHLAPRHFGGEPQLGEGNIRFSLNRVPDCVAPEKLERAINSPLSSGRLIGRSFDYPAFSGPNGLLAERIDSAGLYSPATRPEIFYQRLPAGFYRLVIALAQNNGIPTAFHAVTNFEVLQEPGNAGSPHTAEECKGKVSSADAAKAIQ